MMASVQCETDMHEVRCFVPTYDGAHEPIRKSLISGADAEQANQKAQMATHMYVSEKLMYFCSRCCSVTLPLCCIFVDFSEQFVLTGKCHATLSALPPPLLRHPLSLSLHLSLFPFLSRLVCNMERFFPPLFSHLIMSFVFPLYISSPPC